LCAALLAGVMAPFPSVLGGETADLQVDGKRNSMWGATECEFNAGFFSSFTTQGGGARPAINYQLQTLRLGWMLEDEGRPATWRRNAEFLVGIFGGPVTKGPGSGLAGAEFILRYNFSGRGSRFRPFAQIGAGGLYNDIHKNRQQIVIGMGFEFMLHAGFGTHIMLRENWALNLEAGYRHISNAELSSRNGGLNSFGGTIGFSYFFR
jgi:hypothetical protein